MSDQATKLLSPRFSIAAAKRFKPNLPLERRAQLEEVRIKLQKEYRWEKEACVCGMEQSLIIAEYDRYSLPLSQSLCIACGTIRVNPYLNKKSATDFYARHYQKLYGRSPDKAFYFARQRQYGAKYYHLASTFLNLNDWVFEIGCGAGGALSFFQEKGCKVAGCDFDENLLSFGRRQGLPHLVVGSFQELTIQLPKQKAKLIFLNHVLEHVLQPAALLKVCRETLVDQGQIILAVPDIESIKLNDAYQGDLLRMFHIAHKYNFSFSGLQRMATTAGLKAKRIYPDPALKTHTSNMGELWMQFEKLKEPDTVQDTIATDLGWKRFHNLVQHESKYQKYRRLSFFNFKKYRSIHLFRKLGSKLKDLLSTRLY